MDEYTPLDLVAFHNAGLALLREQGTAPPLGRSSFVACRSSSAPTRNTVLSRLEKGCSTLP